MGVEKSKADEARAARRAKEARKGAQSAKPNPFVQLEPDTAQLAEIKAWEPDMHDMDSSMLRYIEAGYKLSFKWDTWSESHAAWLIAPEESDDGNAGMILSGRGSTPFKALRQIMWKLAFIKGRAWREWADNSMKTAIDD